MPVNVPEPDAASDPESGQLALFEGAGEALPPPAPRLRELTVVPEPPLHRVSRLSFSALSLFERCSYRYYAERVAGMRPAPWGPAEGATAGCIRPRSAMPSIGCSSASISAPRPPRRASRSSSAPGIRW